MPTQINLKTRIFKSKSSAEGDMLCDVIDVHFLSMEKSYIFSWGIRVDGKTREVCVGVINTEFRGVATSFRKQGESCN